MLSFFKKKKKEFFDKQEQQLIVQAVRQAEHQTSGEIRVYIETLCPRSNSFDRAKEVFEKLSMYKTSQRNAVLIYLSTHHRQVAVYADAGIYQKLGEAYWANAVTKMIAHFKATAVCKGLCGCITEIGEALKIHFPYTADDKNELPNDIVFGQ